MVLDTEQSQGPGYYHLDNQYGCECGLKEARSIQTSQPGIQLKGGVGWSGENGCLVDTDSDLRQNIEVLTNRRVINQLTTRLSSTTPNYSKGYYDVDTESIIRSSNITKVDRPCNVISGSSTLPYSLTPQIDRLSKEVQNTQFIIPEDSMESWVRGGLPSRQIVRNMDYMRRCQQKN